MREFAGKVAVVTGGASGIGRGIVLACARAGMHTVVGDVDPVGAQTVAEEAELVGPRSLAVATDVTDPAAVEALADKTWAEFGRCHLVCNNAGVAVARPLAETSLEDWSWTLQVNLMGVVHGVSSFVPRLKIQGEPAHVVNTASMSGHLATPLLGAYTASKYAIVGLSECLKLELDDHPVGVSVLCPGPVATRIGDAGRNRPQALGQAAPIPIELRDALAGGMDAERAGRIVLRGIAEDEFWIFSHPELQPAVDARSGGIAAAFDRWREWMAGEG
ncbi:MAG: short-chain dehydrogenase [Deltaproteobacteria bacterium]|nr:short-chain dehydrogenase [Deltaproteobacteria bacterium]